MSDFDEKMKANYEIAYPFFVKVICIVYIAFFGCILFFCIKNNEGLFCDITFGLFLSLGIYGIFSAVFWKIKVDGDEISYRSMFGTKYPYKFEDITRAVEFNHFGNNAIRCYKGTEKMFTIDNNVAGYYQFQIDLKVRKIPIDRSKRRMNDPMNKYEDMMENQLR